MAPVSKRSISILVAAGSLAVPSAAAAAEFDGMVVSVNRDKRSFKLHDSERGTKRIFVRRSTRFERVDGLAGLKAGQRNIEAVVERRDGKWIAIEVERSGGGGEHGGDDD